MSMKMQKAAYMRGIDKMVIKEIPVPEIGDNEVLVHLEYVGICGSDVHSFHSAAAALTKWIWKKILCLDMNVQEL